MQPQHIHHSLPHTTSHSLYLPHTTSLSLSLSLTLHHSLSLSLTLHHTLSLSLTLHHTLSLTLHHTLSISLTLHHSLSLSLTLHHSLSISPSQIPLLDAVNQVPELIPGTAKLCPTVDVEDIKEFPGSLTTCIHVHPFLSLSQ